MKKSRIAALALAAGLTLTGVGYAYWTDTLTINNTVTTGTFDVNFIKGGTGGGDAKEWPGYVYSDAKADPNGNTVKTVVTNKEVTAYMRNLYPGAHGWVNVTMRNDGTVPVVFDNAEVTLTGDETALGKISFATGFTIFKADGTIKDESKSGTTTWGWGSYLNQNRLQDEINRILNGKRLEPGESLALDMPKDVKQEAFAKLGLETASFEDENCIFFNLPTTIENKDNVEGKEVGVKVVINWKQHNK